MILARIGATRRSRPAKKYAVSDKRHKQSTDCLVGETGPQTKGEGAVADLVSADYGWLLAMHQLGSFTTLEA
jgi:hypothetical protein